MSNHLYEAARRLLSNVINSDMYVSGGTQQAESAQRFEGNIADFKVTGGVDVPDGTNVSPATTTPANPSGNDRTTVVW